MCQALNSSEVDYLIVGGVLVSLYGEPRSAKGIDVIIVLNLVDDSVLRFLYGLKKV